MATKATILTVSLGLSLGGALVAGPAQADPRNDYIELPPDRYYHTFDSCSTEGQKRVRDWGWAAFDCVTITNKAGNVTIYWLEYGN
ncbi:hypothetical protein AB0J83_47950 [Actinoplanes sp. NPDC049596]|uniref:hypothetical protein n=1 Tax=unclassified Actinoplanes TaxID=2626549 RepID=UPI00343F5569